jgi:hypothetical protein
MRELRLLDDDGLDRVFDDIAEYSALCHFKDCGHDQEPGCAVKEAIAAGALAPERLEHYQKLEREAQAYERATTKTYSGNPNACGDSSTTRPLVCASGKGESRSRPNRTKPVSSGSPAQCSVGDSQHTGPCLWRCREVYLCSTFGLANKETTHAV